jgi:xylose isomerase
MRTYLILKEKASHWNSDKDIQAILKEISQASETTPATGKFTKQGCQTLMAHEFDKDAIMKKRLPYERLDQLTIDILAGVR